jgi:5-methylthioadenosine/S-adenosylhomocysteine deaminase
MAIPSDNSCAVDTLIHARWLLTMQGPRQVLEHHSIAIEGNSIRAIGPTAELRASFTATREFELGTHVVMPGLVNAHTHSPMSLFRGYADDLPLQPWLEQKIWPAESRWVNEEFVRAGASLGISEMLLSGTTCFSDMYFFPEQIAKVVEQSGIRAQLASPVLDFPTVWAGDAAEYIAKATKLHDDYRNHERVRVAFGPHAPYTVSDEPLLKIAMLAEELDIGIHMHIHENPAEISDAMQHKGMRPLTRLKQLDFLGPRLQGVHLTQLNEEEISLLATLGVHAIHCPASSLKLACGISPVPALLAAGVNVSLGTDGAASNNNLDMFVEMRLAALLHKGCSGEASVMPAWQVVQMATINGARTLGMEECIGSLDIGKLADVIAVDLSHPHTSPVYDPISTLVYSARSDQVSHSWIHGTLVMENRSLLHLDLPAVLAEASRWSHKIMEQ